MAAIRLDRRPTVPGEILLRHYLEPNNLSISAFAKRLGISRKHLSDIVHGHARMTPYIVVRLAHCLDTSASFWANLQAAVDVFDAEREYMQTYAVNS